MSLFIKGFVIGIAKIIPGVSGAMLAINFNVYDKLIDSITSFFDNKKENFKFLFMFGSGIFMSIIFFSNIIRYLINNYYFVVMMLFTGLITGGTYNFSKNIKYTIKNKVIIILVILLMFIISFFNINNSYTIQNNFLDYLMFFIGGIIEVFSSIVPGISGTALLMLIGIYDNILMLFSNIYNIDFLINNIMIYISYGVGLFVSFIVCSLIVSCLLKQYRMLFDTVVLGLSIASILLLIFMIFKNGFIFIELVIGIILFFLGIFISYVFDR